MFAAGRGGYVAASDKARSATRRPTIPPPTAPASQSSGKWMPAHSRESVASLASARFSSRPVSAVAPLRVQ